MKMNNKLISVIMSVFNNEKDVNDAVKSILNQTYNNFEFLIMDDASQDDTLSILKNLKDKRIKLFHNEQNIGLTKSLNVLISKSKGHFIARQDADDLSLKTRFEDQINVLQNKNVKACTTRATIKNSKKIIPKWSFYIPHNVAIKYKNPFIHGTLMIDKETLKKIGKYDERFKYAQDFKLFTDLINSNVKIKTLNKSLYVLNMQNNISTNKKNEQQYYADCVIRGSEPNL